MDSYTASERAARGRKFAKARAAAAEESRMCALMARSGYADGVTEKQLADQFGVNRLTIRNWLGK